MMLFIRTLFFELSFAYSYSCIRVILYSCLVLGGAFVQPFLQLNSINFSLSPHLGVWGVPLGLRGKGMVSSRKVSYIVFIMHVVLMHVHVLVGLNVSVIKCILVWIHVYLRP